jgi:hypothetical protein
MTRQTSQTPWWHKGRNEFVTAPAVDAFVTDIAEVCRRHGFDLGHEDSHGAFIIEKRGPSSAPPGHAVMWAHLSGSIEV